MGKFEITKRKNGKFQFNLKAGNGQIIDNSKYNELCKIYGVETE